MRATNQLPVTFESLEVNAESINESNILENPYI